MSFSKLDVDKQSKSSLALVLSFFFLITGCTSQGGNFSSEENKIVWASNKNLQSIPANLGIETFNIFSMDADGLNQTQLTNDVWPIINQHPVFTPNGEKIVWLRGKSLWIMNLDGSDPSQLSHPSADEEDGHPWVGADKHVYFSRVVTRDQPPFNAHRIWRMQLDGTNAVEIIGGTDKDRFHPNLHQDKNQVVYTAGPPGSGMGMEIRVFNLSTNEDRLLIGPGAFSAAILHPDGDKLVLAQNPDGNQNYEIAEYEFPSGNFIQQISADGRNNTIPYYDYPAGQRIIWVSQADRATQRRRTRHIWLKASDPKPLTSGAFENTQIVGQMARDPSNPSGCIFRPVGCFPTPPPCQQILLPGSSSDDAIELGLATARANISSGNVQNIAPEGYRTFMEADLTSYLDGNDSHVTGELRQRAQSLSEFLLDSSNESVNERVADFYVNSYLDAASKSGED